MRLKSTPILLTAGFLLATFSLLAAGEKDKPKEPQKPVNPFMAAVGDKGRAKAGEEVTLSNKDLDEMPPGDLPAGDAGEEQTPLPTPAPAKKPDGDSLSFSNDDLKAMFGEPEEAPEPADAEAVPAGQDPLEWMEQRKQAEAERASSADEARQRVATAEKRVKDLEAKLLALRNPLLTRRTGERGADPDASDEDKAAYDGAGARSRVEMTEKELEEARKELAEARQAAGGR